ncbi:Retinoic acid induced 16-like protein [Penicillium chermesinum]|nr:Retinoic acid induced 16-like protein [Penicillium chermesinum]
MDFWSRLIGGSRSLSKSSRVTSPAERLTAFKRACNALQQIWRSTNSPSGEQPIAHSRAYIDRLNAILSDESRGPAPHPCVAYAASSQIFVTVTKLALSYYDDDILRSATVFFNTLIDAEVDGVVDNRLFARALVDLVRRANKSTSEIEGRLVELLFGIANNIRLQPSILPAWFVPRVTPVNQDGESSGPSGAEFAGATRKDEFPLFYLLVDYVHSDGRAGDFARTGLLYLIETASRSKNLEKWLIESDLATLMATGLGALYSQLGSLNFPSAEENVPRIVALSDHAAEDTALQPELGETMDSFMSYLLFWQDTIDHCKSVEVNDTLLDHFQVLFLEQLLYPSLLESSDVAGGSTAAVLTYLCRILSSIEQVDENHSTYWLPYPRRQINLLHLSSTFEIWSSSGIQSSNRQTVLATLRLLNVVLQKHHSFARSLIHTLPSQPAQQRSIGAFNMELEQLLGLGTSLLADPKLDEAYDNYVSDATWVLESRLCLPAAEDDNSDDTIPFPLQILQDDPIVQGLLRCLDSFFTNSVIVNLALTGVLISLASSHLFALDGWVLVDPSLYDLSSEGAPDDDLEKVQRAYQTPTWPDTAVPTLTSALQRLVNQVRQWQRELPDFDVLIAARRDVLQRDERPETPEQKESSEAQAPRSADRSRPLHPGSPEPSISRERSPHPIYSPPPPSSRGESSVQPNESRGSSQTRVATAEALRKRLATAFPPPAAPAASGSTTDSPEAKGEEEAEPEGPPAVTLGHVLTNVVILYEFLLELSAVVQARGSLFEEAGYN